MLCKHLHKVATCVLNVMVEAKCLIALIFSNVLQGSRPSGGGVWKFLILLFNPAVLAAGFPSPLLFPDYTMLSNLFPRKKKPFLLIPIGVSINEINSILAL